MTTDPTAAQTGATVPVTPDTIYFDKRRLLPDTPAPRQYPADDDLWARAWYHGGPSIRGNWLTPAKARPNRAGSTRHALSGSQLQALVTAELYRPDRVYLLATYPGALLFAAIHDKPTVYVCTPHGLLEEDPDYIGGEGQSVRTLRAHIVARITPPPDQIAQARRTIVASLDTGAPS